MEWLDDVKNPLPISQCDFVNPVRLVQRSDYNRLPVISFLSDRMEDGESEEEHSCLFCPVGDVELRYRG